MDERLYPRIAVDEAAIAFPGHAEACQSTQQSAQAMNENYRQIIAASDDDRRGLFLTTAQRLGTTLQNIEKDFWVCWTLDVLFHQLPAGGPRLLFKGGTSLSKGYNLISRFSEDIDITVFRDDLGEKATASEFEKLSKTGRGKRLDAIKQTCQTYINGPLLTVLSDLAAETMAAAGQDPARLTVVPDTNDADKQSLLIRYPSVVNAESYIAPFVKIESGAKSALDPHAPRTIIPYVATELPQGDNFKIVDVTTINPELTFLDKVLILHGVPIFFAKYGRLLGAGRVSRHYYDIHLLVADPVGKKACTDTALIGDCIDHARMFFYRKDTGLKEVKRGTFRLSPSGKLIDYLRRDYDAMTTMIFGAVPDFKTVLNSIATAEAWLNDV
jgi:hypothetical protein